MLFRAAVIKAISLSDYLTATVKVSICGNNIVEGGEDCEGLDLDGESCESIGFGPGSLSCDIACSFDTSGCTPAPSPSPSPSPSVSPSPAASASPTTTTTTGSTTSTTTTSPEPKKKLSLPTMLLMFDPNNDDRLSLGELYVVTKTWVEEWRQAIIEELTQEKLAQAKICDLNRDSRCNLTDFSILMSYVGR